MPTGHYKRKPHTEERKRNMSKAHMGIKKTKEDRENISRRQRGDKNHRWKGEDANKNSKHRYVAKIKPKPKGCGFCGKEGKRLALANLKDHNYTKNPDDYKWLCYSCHKKFDLKCAYCGEKDKDIKLRMVCSDCYVDGFNVWKKLAIQKLKDEIYNYNKVKSLTKTSCMLIIDNIFGNALVHSSLSRDSVRETRLEGMPKVTRLGRKLKSEDTPDDSVRPGNHAIASSGNHSPQNSGTTVKALEDTPDGIVPTGNTSGTHGSHNQDCTNCGERKEDHIDFDKGFGSKGDTCPHRKSMKFSSGNQKCTNRKEKADAYLNLFEKQWKGSNKGDEK